MTAYKATQLDDIAAEKWPYWAPVRHHFDIQAFGADAWRGGPGDEVVEKHSEGESGQEELYLVLGGRATFTIGAARVAFAVDPNTGALSIGAKAGEAYAAGGWDTGYLGPSPT
ncbi:MAG: hypothetical protein ACYDCH_13380 [Gaiellaceae bacterium]